MHSNGHRKQGNVFVTFLLLLKSFSGIIGRYFFGRESAGQQTDYVFTFIYFTVLLYVVSGQLAVNKNILTEHCLKARRTAIIE